MAERTNAASRLAEPKQSCREEYREIMTGKRKASLVCGTCGDRLWLLRSRPDQVDQATMRRGPPTEFYQQSRHRRRLFCPASPFPSQSCAADEARIRSASPAASDAELLPEVVDPGFDLVGHGNRSPPFPTGFSRPLVGRIDAHLAAQAADRRSKIQIIDRRLID